MKLVRERGSAGEAEPLSVPERGRALSPVGGPEARRADPGVCLTAGEVDPKLDRTFLAAKGEVIVSLRIFDPATRLRSPEAREIGEDWFDLIVHVQRKGVSFTLNISDFDPIVSTNLHQATWSTPRRLVAAREVTRAGKRFAFVAAPHPALVGLLPTIGLFLLIIRELRARAAELSAPDKPAMVRALENAPARAPDRLRRPTALASAPADPDDPPPEDRGLRPAPAQRRGLDGRLLSLCFIGRSIKSPTFRRGRSSARSPTCTGSASRGRGG